jgi:type I restriction-modification system DNA methylase subunit
MLAYHAEHVPGGVYRNAGGLCKVATLAEITARGWSLNPGCYVGVAARDLGWWSRRSARFQRSGKRAYWIWQGWILTH